MQELIIQFVQYLASQFFSFEVIEGINIWHDQLIKPGDDWKKEIREHMAMTKVAILMVSTAFLISDFIHNEELPLLLKAAKDEGAKIIWIPVRFSYVRNF